MELIYLIVKTLESILLIYLGFTAIYLLIFSLAGLLKHKLMINKETIINKIAVFIPAYKEDSVIIEVAEEALKQDYPSDHFDIIIIADSLKPETIGRLKKFPLKVIEVSFEKSTKSKALNMAMSNLPDNYYDIAVILDADNVMETNFLTRINKAFCQGFKAIQGHRSAKNLDTNLAILDALSEEINNHIFRLGHRVLGLSAALIGSGMAFDYSFFKKMMLNIKAIGGFDKEIELTMLKNRDKIEYLDDAILYDEKVSKSDVFTNQRRRWLSAQIHYGKSISNAFKHLITQGNIDYFDKSLQMILPPRVLLLGILIICGLIALLFNSTFLQFWIFFLFVTILAFLFAIPLKFYSFKTIKALILLPTGFFLMFKSLLKTKGANKQFIHTQHVSKDNFSK